MAQPIPAKYSEPPSYFGEALEDAERLLKYTAETGIEVSDDIRDHILQARAALSEGWDETTASNLLTALAKLAALLKPITALSLKACSDDTKRTLHNYWKWAICLAIVIVPFSVLSFVVTAISNTIRADITTANDLAVKLHTQLEPAPSPAGTAPSAAGAAVDSVVIPELQQFAATIRAIEGRSRELNRAVLFLETDPNPPRQTLQLPTGQFAFSPVADRLTSAYQDIRYFAQSLLDDVSLSYGAITACLLPVFYALLGTCAYLLRTFESQMATRTFIPSADHSARFLVAAIGGAVVGLFNNFTVGQGASLPPLAIAFIVGYAVDVFFAFLEGMLQPFTKIRGSAPASGAKD